jgi:hypothetical protein
MKAGEMQQEYWKGYDVIGSILGWLIGTAVFGLACFVELMYAGDISSGHTKLDGVMYFILAVWAVPIWLYLWALKHKISRIFK